MTLNKRFYYNLTYRDRDIPCWYICWYIPTNPAYNEACYCEAMGEILAKYQFSSENEIYPTCLCGEGSALKVSVSLEE